MASSCRQSTDLRGHQESKIYVRSSIQITVENLNKRNRIFMQLFTDANFGALNEYLYDIPLSKGKNHSIF